MKFNLITTLAFAFLLASSGLGYAADDTVADDTAADDTAADDTTTTDDDTTPGNFTGTLTFTSPVSLEGAMQYEFAFTVTNTTTVGASIHEWIEMVDLYMPSDTYEIDTDSLMAPDDLHGGSWGVRTLPIDDPEATPIGLRWEFTTGTTSASFGDIREDESLDFAFRATTDEQATDGFNFKLYSDSGAYVSGTACITTDCGETSDDTEEDDTSDDDAADDGGGGDDDDGGCGC